MVHLQLEYSMLRTVLTEVVEAHRLFDSKDCLTIHQRDEEFGQAALIRYGGPRRALGAEPCTRQGTPPLLSSPGSTGRRYSTELGAWPGT